MGIFDIFTGDAMKEAAEKSRQFLEKTRTEGRNDIESGLLSSLGYVQGGTQGARTALDTGYQDAIRRSGEIPGQAYGYADAGTADAIGRLDQAAATARGDYQPLSELGTKYGNATSLYQDALGVNGADGAARAGAAFAPSTAYNFNLDQGLEAINRRRNAAGMLASGNADRDAQEYGAGLASKEHGAWLDRLGGFVNPELAATSGAASGMAGVTQATGLAGADLMGRTGLTKAALEASRGAMLSDLASKYGSNLAGLEERGGNTLANLATGATNQKVGLATGLAQPYSNTYTQEGQAETAGSANLWGLGLNLAKLGTGIWGGGGGGFGGG